MADCKKDHDWTETPKKPTNAEQSTSKIRYNILDFNSVVKTMILAHVIALDPTCKQANALARACGVARFTYNWALAEWKRQYQAGEKPTANKLSREFNAIKGEQFPWIYESPRDANSRAFADLNVAFRNFFASVKGKRKGRKIGYPTMRKKGVHNSFYVANDKFRFDADGKHVVLPVIGKVKIHEPLRLHGKILSGRVKRRAGRWFLAVQVECGNVERAPCEPRRVIVGVDLGLKTAVVPSQGSPFKSPKPLKASLLRLRRANRALHRRKKGGSNRHKAQKRVARLHYRIACIRHDFWHKTTTQLCRENQTIVIEDLSMAFMLKNRKLARSAADTALGMFRPMLAYKAILFGCRVVVADKWFPSTQRCSSCENVRTGKSKVVLGESEYLCDSCGVVEDRDENAAKNLEQYPRLEGNWGHKTQTPMDDLASAVPARAGTASRVAEVGTKPCSRAHLRKQGS